jgi:hypothetical protein
LGALLNGSNIGFPPGEPVVLNGRPAAFG